MHAKGDQDVRQDHMIVMQPKRNFVSRRLLMPVPQSYAAHALLPRKYVRHQISMLNNANIV